MDRIAFSDLPVGALASILVGFCDGKALSTVLTVCLGDSTRLRHSAFDVCRGVLVERFVGLSSRLRNEVEIRDVVDVIREDVRLSQNDDHQLLQLFSEWCALLDYFEVQLRVSKSLSFNAFQWVVWSGRVTLVYGEISAFLVTNDWSAGALQYWRSAELASSLNFARPRNRTSFVFASDRIPYATLLAVDTADKMRMTRQATDLHVEAYMDTDLLDDTRYTLVPQNQAYEGDPDIVLCDHSLVSHRHQQVPVGPLLIGSQVDSSLCCCWDKEHGEEDWEQAVSALGRSVIRIMKSFGGSFEEVLKLQFSRVNEFSNLRS